AEGDIIRAAGIEDLRRELRRYRDRGIETFLLPHHIGYRQGYRGINWATYTPEFSPVVEIMSMHGASESADAPYPYLHTMGPRNWQSTWQYGLAQGNVVGVMGSTDHHSGHPGSYGHGRLAVWADALDRDAIWTAIRNRRTVALTGDNIRLKLALDGSPIGTVLPPRSTRNLHVEVEGGAALDYVEVVHNTRPLYRWNPPPVTASLPGEYKVHFEVGWAEKGETIPWDVALEVEGGELLSVEPRFRGHEVVAPQQQEEERYAFSEWRRDGSNRVHFTTLTWGNPTTTTASTQGVCLTVKGDRETVLCGTINGQPVRVRLEDLLEGPVSGYLGGFLTPAYCFNRATPREEYTARFEFDHRSDSATRDWYYVRVRQKNNQWAWSSPIWVEGAAR